MIFPLKCQITYTEPNMDNEKMPYVEPTLEKRELLSDVTEGFVPVLSAG